MIERDLELLWSEVKNRGLRQQILVGALRMGFQVVRVLGLKDIPPPVEEKVEDTSTAQIGRMLALGFHAELGIPEDEYVDGMPPLPLQPERFKGRFDLPLLVDPRVSLPRQLKMHGVRTVLTEAQLAQIALSMIKAGENTQRPYYMWVEEGVTIKNIGLLSWNEQPINVIEAFALIRERPNIFRLLGTFSFDLANLVSEDRIASIVAAGSKVPGPLGFVELDEKIKILSSDYFSNDSSNPYEQNALVLKGRI